MPEYMAEIWQERLGLGPDHRVEQVIEAADDEGAVEQAQQLVCSLESGPFNSVGLKSVFRTVDGDKVLVWPASS